jgi:hypothetical protein
MTAIEIPRFVPLAPPQEAKKRKNYGVRMPAGIATDDRILQAITWRAMTPSEIATLAGKSVPHIRWRLATLQKLNKVRPHGVSNTHLRGIKPTLWRAV